jgi:prefoldin subunit 5
MKTPNHIGNLAPTIEGLQAQIASLTAEIERLREALQTADETLIEINLSNYGMDDVDRLNNSSIEASQIIRAALQPKEGNQ